MFGYIRINPKELSREQKDRYQAFYCGLCHALGAEYGGAGRATLTYDMTFLAILLSSAYELEEESKVRRCPVNPLRKCACLFTPATRYAADMNVLLAYYQALDDVRDEGSAPARGRARALKEKLPEIRARWPEQCRAVEEGLEALTRMERENELNPDLPANAFGALMGELFAGRGDERGEQLRRMGSSLGRFIYLMDAGVDLKQDIKKERYNPLVGQLDTDFTPMLTMMIGECCHFFEALSLSRDVGLLRNILYSGVWVRYKTLRDREGKG